MFFYEDFLDNIQNLPQEVRDGLEKIGEVDKEVKESMEYTEKNVDALFSNAIKMDPEDLDASFKAIMKDGEKSIEQSDTKIKLASDIQALMEKYMSLLDNQLDHFKLKLEANNNGITNIIEKRVLDEEQSKITKLQGKRGQLNRCLFGGKQGVLGSSNFNQKLFSVASSSAGSDETTSSSERVRYVKNSPHASTLSKSFEEEKSDNPVNASSTSQAVIANQKTSKRRQKVSLRATNSKPLQSTFSKEENKLSSTSSTKNKKKQEKCQTPSESGTESIDSNEPRYCICNDVAYGSMVACDNKTCAIEWFHYECVGVERRPRGKWYCSSCAKNVKNCRYRKST